MKVPIKEVTGQAFYLPDNDVDTDRIIPARFLKCLTFEGLGEHAFEDARAQDKDHPFNVPRNKERNILIVGDNFACGSSREHAVAAIRHFGNFGIDAIVGISFAKIFRGNATGTGLVCVDIKAEEHAALVDIVSRFQGKVVINLEKMEVMFQHEDLANWPIWSCTMPPADRDMFLDGSWEAITTLLEAGDEIEKTAARLGYIDQAA